MAKIGEELARQGARRSVKQAAGQELVIHELPRRRGEVEAELVVRFMVEDLLVIGTHEATCVQILQRLTSGSPQGELLQSLAAYRQIMDRVAAEAGQAPPQIRWYVDPFGYAQVLRAASGGPKKRRKDMLAILQNEGFDAIQALGGFVHLATGDYEMLHRTQIYAPAVAGAPEKYRLAARLLEFPNSHEWNGTRGCPESWRLPRGSTARSDRHSSIPRRWSMPSRAMKASLRIC